MKHETLNVGLLGLAVWGSILVGGHAQKPGRTQTERPNILWLTSEDNSAYWLGCYGNELAETPNLDRLADRGILYENAYANAPVCAVARSTLILGMYAPSVGLQHMRSRYRIPQDFRTYTECLREAGYYVTNASKTDFNFQADMGRVFDDLGSRAHWRDHQDGQPFFAIINDTVSHESSLFPQKIKRSRTEQNILPDTPRTDPEAIKLPAYLPDDPEIREDHAIYHDVISALDRNIGKHLKELDEAGEADNTIVFYYSDHGGVIPRAKRYLYETGTHVPLIIYFPEKWAHLAPGKPGSRSPRPVSFADFGPTVLSLCGVDIPENMQGKPFLGVQDSPDPAAEVFLYADRFDGEMLKFDRGVTDGDYRYIRNFHSHRPRNFQVGYPYGQDGWNAWLTAWKEGRDTLIGRTYWVTPQPVEELYHTTVDPWEVRNLAADPAHQQRLHAMRTSCLGRMLDIRDSGIVPESMVYQLIGAGTVYDYIRDPQLPYQEILELVVAATDRDASRLPELIKALDATHPLVRYWGAVGCAMLGTEAGASLTQIRKLTTDPFEGIQVAANTALLEMGKTEEGVQGLVEAIRRPVTTMAPLEAANTLLRFGQGKAITQELLDHVKRDTDRANDKNLSYVHRACQSVYNASRPRTR